MFSATDSWSTTDLEPEQRVFGWHWVWFDVLGLVRGLLWRDAEHIHVPRLLRARIEPRILKYPALKRNMQ